MHSVGSHEGGVALAAVVVAGRVIAFAADRWRDVGEPHDPDVAEAMASDRRSGRAKGSSGRR